MLMLIIPLIGNHSTVNFEYSFWNELVLYITKNVYNMFNGNINRNVEKGGFG